MGIMYQRLVPATLIISIDVIRAQLLSLDGVITGLITGLSFVILKEKVAATFIFSKTLNQIKP